LGRKEDGSIFEDSEDSIGYPLEFQLGVNEVIKCMEEGILEMSLNEKALLTCDPQCAYGARGFPPLIAPNEVISFEIELVEIKN